MAKKPAVEAVNLTMTVYTHLIPGAFHNQAGEISEVNASTVRVDYKRPRASKFDALVLPVARVHSTGFDTAGTGFVAYTMLGGTSWSDDTVQSDSIFITEGGLLSATNAAGFTYLLNPAFVDFAQYDTGAEPAAEDAAEEPAAAKPTKGGKGAKPAAAEPEAEPEEPAAAAPAPKATKGSKGSKPTWS